MVDQTNDAGPVNTVDYSLESSNLSVPKPSHQPSPGSVHTSGSAAPFYSQYSSLPAHQQQMNPPRSNQQLSANHYAPPTSQNQHGAGFDMSGMAGSLPNYGNPSLPVPPQYRQDQRRPSGPSTPAVVYQLQQNVHYPPGAASFTNPAPYPAYGPAPYTSYPPGQISSNVPYSPYDTAQPRQGPGAIHYSQYSQHIPPQYYYYPTGYGPASPPHFGNQTGHMQFGYAGKSSSSGPLGPQPVQDGEGRLSTAGEDHYVRREPSNSSLSAVPRGPPRKPKQSGHALWVGNLPPGATVLDLKDHFSRDATRDIESLFLISKSNCGFVNYRTEDACAAAMQRFHDSRFQGIRLVCRLRRTSTPSPVVPVGPASTTVENTRSPSPSSSRSSLPKISAESDDAGTQVEEVKVEELANAARVSEKYFVVKSLTLQDLEQSVRNGIWATQAHNEQSLNKAFETADQVFLIFSANKSGEYFGYARMVSPIGANSDELKVLSQQASVVEPVDAPRKIPTPATEFAPKGHIIDDSARGTIFWEADLSDQEDEEEVSPPANGEVGTDGTDDRPFRVEWISTSRLPFYRTRGLRNPWNANREVKIARDGTELETSVGKRLIQMFHRPAPLPGPAGVATSITGIYPPEMGGTLPNQLGYQR